MQNSPDLLTRALQNPTLREAELGRRRARDGTDGDVLAWIEATFGVRIPAVVCCPGHVALVSVVSRARCRSCVAISSARASQRRASARRVCLAAAVGVSSGPGRRARSA